MTTSTRGVSPTKKTMIVDVVFVNNVLWVEGWERGESGED
jgi:hypothetical protein